LCWSLTHLLIPQAWDSAILGDEIEYAIGTWGSDGEKESSNYKGLCNNVDAIECHAKEKRRKAY
jgi:hypothetical protein